MGRGPSKVVAIRLPLPVLELWQERAKRQGVPMGTLIRLKLEEAVLARSGAPEPMKTPGADRVRPKRPAVPPVPGVVKGVPADHEHVWEYSSVLSRHKCKVPGCGEVKK
jgi:hypothetical protein